MASPNAGAGVKYVVQDAETGLFLMPAEGDVGFTPWLHEAGRFDQFGEAHDTATFNCHQGFYITSVVPAGVGRGIH